MFKIKQIDSTLDLIISLNNIRSIIKIKQKERSNLYLIQTDVEIYGNLKINKI